MLVFLILSHFKVTLSQFICERFSRNQDISRIIFISSMWVSSNSTNVFFVSTRIEIATQRLITSLSESSLMLNVWYDVICFDFNRVLHRNLDDMKFSMISVFTKTMIIMSLISVWIMKFSLFELAQIRVLSVSLFLLDSEKTSSFLTFLLFFLSKIWISRCSFSFLSFCVSSVVRTCFVVAQSFDVTFERYEFFSRWYILLRWWIYFSLLSVSWLCRDIFHSWESS